MEYQHNTFNIVRGKAEIEMGMKQNPFYLLFGHPLAHAVSVQVVQMGMARCCGVQLYVENVHQKSLN